MNHMADVSAATDTFGLAVDHFGQDVSSGTRGSTAKESAASAIFYLRGKCDENGVFTDTRLSLRKQRAGPQGMVFPFAGPEVQMGNDKYGMPVTSRIIDWNVTRPEPAKAKPPAQVMLEEVVAATLKQHGEQIEINGTGTVRAVREKTVRAAFKEA